MLCALCVLRGGSLLSAQQMPDPKQMSGIPRPVDDLPTGSVSVRLIKGSLSNNIANHPVTMQIGGETRTVNTDADGRAQFDKLPAGTTLKASSDVDGEHLESQAFPAPAAGGIRLMLVATDKEKEAADAPAANAPAVTAPVVLGGDSRIVIEPGDETLSFFYLFEIINNAKTPVNPPTPIQFDLPSGSTSGAVLQGSSPRATVDGTHVRILGPFPPGKTAFDIGGEMPVTHGTIEMVQALPVTFEQLVVVVKKEGDLKLTSPQLERVQDTTVEGTPVIIGAGGTMQPGQAFTFTLSGLPHHSNTPRYVALSLVAAIVLVGIFAFVRPVETDSQVVERKKIVARREKLLQDLVRLEQEHRRGRIDEVRYAERREELFKTLEQVYGALDASAADEEIVRSASSGRPLRPVGAS